MAATPTQTITILPVAPGDIVTGADAGSAVWHGAERGLDGQHLFLVVEGDGVGPFQATFQGNATTGAWSIGGDLAGVGWTDGVYSATVEYFNGQPTQGVPTVQASETFIIAEHDTAFESVGLSFIDANRWLESNPPAEPNIYLSLAAEQAGLTVLAADGYPKQQMQELLKDVAKELRILDYVPSLTVTAIASAATVDKLEAIQTTMAAYVAHQPALVALMPDHTGW